MKIGKLKLKKPSKADVFVAGTGLVIVLFAIAAALTVFVVLAVACIWLKTVLFG